MEITYAGTTIIDGTTLLPGAGWQRSLQQLVGSITGCGGRPSTTPTARGNRARVVGGSVTHGFDTHGEAVEFWAKHGDTLPNSGDLVVSVGGIAKATWAGAVLESVTAPPPVGVSVTITYTFRLAGPAT